MKNVRVFHSCDVCTKEGKPMAATYITAFGDHQEHFKAVMKTVQDRMVYTCDPTEASE